MNDGTLMRKNLFAKKLRTSLLLISIFVAFLIFGMLWSFDRLLNSGVDTAQANRLVTVNKINFTVAVPVPYVERIRNVEGVRVAAGASWFGGYYQEPRNFLQTFAVQPEPYLDASPELILPAEQREAFLADRTGLLVGRAVADQYGWAVGDNIPIRSSIWQNQDGTDTWQFTVHGIFDGESDLTPTNYAMFHQEYFDESRTFGNYSLSWVLVVTASPELNDQVSRDIDAMFANSPAETETSTEASFNAAFLEQFGNIGLIITGVSAAALASILMIVGNTLVLAIRERTKDIAVMKTLGFPEGRVLRMVLGESMFLSVIGAAAGLGAAALLIVGIKQAAPGQMPGLSMTPSIAVAGMALALVFGFVTGILPALNATRINIATALGKD